MANWKKILSGMRANPQDWRIGQIETVAKRYGINIRKGCGSHVIFEHPGLVEMLSVPAHCPVKPIYVRKFLVLVDKVNEKNQTQGLG